MSSVLDRYDPIVLRALIEKAEPGQLRGLKAMLRAELAGLDDDIATNMRSDPVTMAAYLTKGQIRRWAYAKLLSTKWVDAVEGRSKRQIWNLPARYGKSTIGTRWGSIWTLDKIPTANIILTSYSADLAVEHALFIRNTLQDNPDTFRVRLRRDRQKMNRFATQEGGGVLAAGIEGGITGFGAGGGGGVVCDDPFKNWKEAHSEGVRQMVWDQYRGVLRLRLDDDDAWMIIIQTRWHEQDLSGMLLVDQLEQEDQQEWELVRLPAIAEKYDPDSKDPYLRMPDPLGRKEGEPLEPEKFSIGAVRSRAVDLGTYLAAGLEQQRPAPAEGGEIKRAWWKWETSMPAECDEWISSWDTKLKEKQSGDYIVGQVWGRTGGDFWGFEQLRGQWDMPTMRAAIALLQVRWPKVGLHFIENTGNGPEVMEGLRKANPKYVLSAEIADGLGMTKEEKAAVQVILRRGMSGLMKVNPEGDKRARARAVTPYLEAGNVHLPDGVRWAETLVEECAQFPTGTYNDQVDAWSQGIAILAKRRAPIVAPGGESKTSSWKP